MAQIHMKQLDRSLGPDAQRSYLGQHLRKIQEVVRELYDDSTVSKALMDAVKVLVNLLIGQAVLIDGAIDISAVAAEKFKTVQTMYYRIAGVQYSKTATDNLTFSLAHVVSATKYGVILLQINAAGTVSTKVPAATQAYDDADTALAALPDADADNVAFGYITIDADAGDWTANTDDMTDAGDLDAATFNDAAAPAAITVSSPEALTAAKPAETITDGS